MVVHLLHDAFVAGHILVGTVGLVAFWVPVIGRKGALRHRNWGEIFARSMLGVGTLAIGISTTTLLDPVGTHPHMTFAPEFIAGVFGWMMLYLAILTINLTWYGMACVKNKRDHAANRAWPNLLLQVVLLAAAVNCAVRGVMLVEPLMIGISTIGFATVFTNCWFIFSAKPGRNAWLRQHLKGLVGAGISVYTAFFAFGAVRMAPELALSPVLWAAPCIIGLSIIFYHWWDIWRKANPRARSYGAATAAE